jgi:sugar lactone lactonase YvrE
MRGARSIIPLAAIMAVACAPADDERPARASSGNVDTAGRRAESTRPPAAGTRPRAESRSSPTDVGTTQGLQTPAAARYDPQLDVFFVSNINGHPTRKDNNGWIGRVSAAQPGRAEIFVAGGQDGVYLHAPKGMAIQGDTLWVADIDILRGFNKYTGKFVAAVGFWSKDVRMLNDVAIGSDDALYITDTGVRYDAAGNMETGGDRVYRLAGRAMTEEVKGEMLAQPNGIAFDSANTRFILAPFAGKQLQTWRPGALPEPFVSGPGTYDGVEIVNGRVYVTSWADSSVHVVENGAMRPLIRNLPSPADIGVDTRRGVLAVPLLNSGVVKYYKLP